MSSADLAIDYARRLVEHEAKGAGDIDPALRRLEARTGLGYWTLWGLWNRRRKSVDTDLLGRLRGAYLPICERQAASLKHELAVEQARCPNADFEDLVREADVLVEKIKAARSIVVPDSGGDA